MLKKGCLGLVVAFIALAALGALLGDGAETSQASADAAPASRETGERPQREPSAPPRPGAHWRESIDVSPIDDSQNVYLSVTADRSIPNRYGGVAWPSLSIRCKENTTAAIISWGVYLGLDETRMITRVDSEPAQTRTWSISTSNNAVGRWSGGSAIPFVQSLFGHSELFAQITPYGENPVQARFNISGLEERIGPLREACNW